MKSHGICTTCCILMKFPVCSCSFIVGDMSMLPQDLSTSPVSCALLCSVCPMGWRPTTCVIVHAGSKYQLHKLRPLCRGNHFREEEEACWYTCCKSWSPVSAVHTSPYIRHSSITSSVCSILSSISSWKSQVSSLPCSYRSRVYNTVVH